MGADDDWAPLVYPGESWPASSSVSIVEGIRTDAAEVGGMSEMIERVARRMVRESCDPMLQSEIQIGLYVDKRWEDKVSLARAVIAEMRDAEDLAALVAGKQALYSCSEDPELADARGCWRAMIDAALGEQG